MLIDPLAIARDLRAVELPPEQAEAIASAIARSLSDGAAVKSDFNLLARKIDALETTLTTKLDALDRTMAARHEALDAQLTSKIDNARSSLLVWLMGVIFATAGVIITVLKYEAV